MVRRALVLLVAATIAVMMTMGTALAFTNGGTGGGPLGGAGGAGGGGGGKQHYKVYVCHNWNTHYVSKKQARYWVNNYKYDYYGPCRYW